MSFPFRKTNPKASDDGLGSSSVYYRKIAVERDLSPVIINGLLSHLNLLVISQ